MGGGGAFPVMLLMSWKDDYLQRVWLVILVLCSLLVCLFLLHFPLCSEILCSAGKVVSICFCYNFIEWVSSDLLIGAFLLDCSCIVRSAVITKHIHLPECRPILFVIWIRRPNSNHSNLLAASEYPIVPHDSRRRPFLQRESLKPTCSFSFLTLILRCPFAQFQIISTH